MHLTDKILDYLLAAIGLVLLVLLIVLGIALDLIDRTCLIPACFVLLMIIGAIRFVKFVWLM